jgi:hypothetical protein
MTVKSASGAVARGIRIRAGNQFIHSEVDLVRTLASVFLPLVALSAFAPAAHAAWPNNAFTNAPVCTAANDQFSLSGAADGAGGAIVTWADDRGGGTTSHLYCQHLLPSQGADPAWPLNGVPVCTATALQAMAATISDGAGGALIVWSDGRPGSTSDLYAQHVLASGVVDPAWPADGSPVCLAPNPQMYPVMVSDGAGGAIVAWEDYRSSFGISHTIYAQHLLATGTPDPAWPANGAALCTESAARNSHPAIATDGAGGAIVAWSDSRPIAYNTLYAGHVLASGTPDPAWPANGAALCTSTGDEMTPTIVADGSGGALVAWNDNRSGTNYDIYAQHVLASGLLDPSWLTTGTAICNAVGNQQVPKMIGDGFGGAIVTWQDGRTGVFGVYAQRLFAAGSVDPAWPANGRALYTSEVLKYAPVLTPDGAGGALVAWHQLAGSNYNTYAQHVLVTGVVDPAWPADGRALCLATGNQQYPVVVGDGAGAAIVAWEDSRSGTYDIYAQRVARFGYLGNPEAGITGVKDVLGDQGGWVKLSWDASDLDLAADPGLAAYDVYRSVPAAVAASRGAVRSLRAGDVLPFDRGGLVAFPQVATGYAWEYVMSANASHFTSQYSAVVSTTCDSVAGSNPPTAFLVLARNASGSMFWPSQPALGYSVDNIAPAAPAPFAGQFALGTMHLHWNRNSESDLAGYRLYRAASPSFTPGPANLVASLADTGYADAAGAVFYYRLTAVDIHGNESPAALLSPAATTGVTGGAVPAALVFAAPSPNPASRATTLAFALPRAGRVRLDVLDAAGRRVRSLADGERAAGTHAIAWDLRDAEDHPVAAGLYFLRLTYDGIASTRKLLVTP